MKRMEATTGYIIFLHIDRERALFLSRLPVQLCLGVLADDMDNPCVA